MPKKTVTEGTPLNLDEEKLVLSAIRYNENTKVITSLDKEKKSLRPMLEKALEENGVLTNKNKTLKLSHAGMDVYLKHSMRISTQAKDDSDALKIAREKGYVRTIEIIDEELVAEDMTAGRLLQEDFDKMFNTKETKVFSVEVKGSYGE